LGGRKGIRPIKTEWRVTGIVICLERDADLHVAQLMPLPLTVSCFSKIQIGFSCLVPAHLLSWKKGPLNECMLLCCAQMCMSDMNVADSEVDKSVIELVDHIWTEATGHLDDVLSVPASSVTCEQVKHVT